MPSPEDKVPSCFETELQAFEEVLENRLGVKPEADLTKNAEVLKGLISMDKFDLEALLSEISLISLKDEEYERIQAKLKNLLSDIEEVI